MPWISGLGNKIRLCLIDTNVLWNRSLNKLSGDFTYLTEFLNQRDVGICFSIPSVVEIRRYLDIFNNFIDLADIMPSFALNTFDVISDKEIRKGGKIPIEEIILNSFVPAPWQRDESYSLGWMMNKIYNENPQNDIETALNERNKEVMKIWKENIKLAQEFKNMPDLFNKGLPRFNNEIGYPKVNFLSDIKKENVDFYSKLIGFLQLFSSDEAKKHKKDIQNFTNINNYPTKKLLLCLEYIYLISKRKFTLNDVYDAQILSPSPYMDIVITENFQAQQLKNIRSIVPGLETTEIYSMKSLRQKMESKPNEKKW